MFYLEYISNINMKIRFQAVNSHIEMSKSIHGPLNKHISFNKLKKKKKRFKTAIVS